MHTPKIVSLVASYNPHNPFVLNTITELKKVGKVVLFTTTEVQLGADDVFLYDSSVGIDLVYKPREWIYNNMQSGWDYVLYNEDDILIPESSIHHAIKLYQTLPSHMVPGFARYEYLDPTNKRYIDLHSSNSVHRGGASIVKESFAEFEVWEPWNLHSGNFLFSKSDISNMIENGRFERYYKEFGFQYGFCDQLESAASVLYYNYTKVLPKDVEEVCCHHQPNKYINMAHNYGDACGPSKQDIISEYNNE